MKSEYSVSVKKKRETQKGSKMNERFITGGTEMNTQFLT